MEADVSPCKQKRCTSQPFTEFRDEEISEKIPHNSDLKREPRVIVLALCAPKQMKIQNPISNNPKSKKLDHRKEEERRRRQLLSFGGAATIAVSVYNITDISCRCCCNLLGLKLSGCAVISKGIVVVEGEISCVRRCLNFTLRKKAEKSDSVKVIWQGKAAKPSFGKFSILHCRSEVAVWNFFADLGASHYWDLAVKSNLI